MNYTKLKRLIDFLLALLLLIVLMPVYLIIMLALSFELKSNPFFTQERGLTLSKNRFKIFKFKTIAGSHNGNFKNKSVNQVFFNDTLKDNVPPFAAVLRKTGLDELPQLLNILKGDMSFIGPRPLTINDLELIREQYPEHYRARDFISCKPGLSGLWQLFGKREYGVNNLISLDILYDIHKSFLTDVRLFFASLPVLFSAKNSDAILSNKTTFKLLPLQLYRFLNFNPEIEEYLKARHNEIGYTINLPENWWDKNYSVADKKEEFKDSQSFLEYNISNKNKPIRKVN